MADEVKAPTAVDTATASEETTRPADIAAEPAAAEAKPAEGGDVATSDAATEEHKTSKSKPEPTTDEPAAEKQTADTEEVADDAVAPTEDTTAANGTPVAKKGNNARRKSGAGVPEHKKKTPKGKKPPPELRLNVKPGEMYFVAMKGYPPWPVIVVDEGMLPESLLSKRPVSAIRIDGTYREDFADGGKNAKDRRYPVMFLGTNEFSWEVNTSLQPFDLDHVKSEVEAGNNQKKSKALWQAYEVAAEGHDLDYFKGLLADHDQAMIEDAEAKAAAEAKKQEKKTKGKRKSIVAEESEDVDMEDASEDKPQQKKRKKDTTSDGEPEKAAKTPKTTKLKLTNKTPKEASATKPKKETKPKKSKAKSESEEVEAAKPEEKPMTEEERREKQEKSVLYLRHRLQKGFLARDQAPKEEEMDSMADYMRQLEEVKNLDAETIKKTKVHKVLKAIIKLNSIPKEDEHNFKKRSTDLLQNWSGALAQADAEAYAGEAPATAPVTNGVKHDDEKKEAAKSEEPTSTEAKDGDGDVSMADAKDAPAVEPKETSTAAEPTAAPTAEPATETAAA